MGSHVFATLAVEGLAVFGKRDAEQEARILGALQNLGNTLLNNIIMPTANQLVQTTALAVTQILADIANGNTVLVGKRDNTEQEARILAALQNLGNTIVNDIIMPTANQLVQTAALAVTQVLADIANGNTVLVGKRDSEQEARILGALQNLGNTIVNEVIMPTANQIVQMTALAVTQVLADIANGNTVLVGGKREIDAAEQARIFGLISSTVNSLANSAYDLLNSAVQTASFHIAVTLANIAENGLIGK